MFMNDNNYLISDAWNWSYRLKSKVISPSIFHYLVRDDQNLLECNSNIKFSSYTLDQGHTLKIVSANGTADLYEFRWFLNNEKTGNHFSILKLGQLKCICIL